MSLTPAAGSNGHTLVLVAFGVVFGVGCGTWGFLGGPASNDHTGLGTGGMLSLQGTIMLG